MPVTLPALFPLATALAVLIASPALGEEISSAGKPAQLDIRAAGDHSIRITLRPLDFTDEFPWTPALADRDYPEPAVRAAEIDAPLQVQIAGMHVHVRPAPLRVTVTRTDGSLVQEVEFHNDGSVVFQNDDAPILGMGEGGPQPRQRNWRALPIEFDRRGRFHAMRPRWQANAYGSRNPVPLMIGTSGWALFIATPWGQIDLREEGQGTFTPWDPPEVPEADENDSRRERAEAQRQYTAQIQGRPPIESIIPGVYDVFVFDAQQPADLMQDIAAIAGAPKMPPKWALGYMQSHRTLENEEQLVEIVKTFREKEIPLDAVIYLGTGFCPRGWNLPQPSFEFNPEVFQSDPADVIQRLHDENVKVIVHVVPFQRNRLPTLQGTIPPREGETVDESHILDYWQEHVDLVAAGVDAWWPDEGDWFNLFERIKRHQLYYQGPLFTQLNVRPWSLHRNGHLGIAQWGGWVWSGDTDSSWKTLEGQIAVGINHSLSLSPFWGSDIGGFYPNEELTGELYARWFQFAAFCPSFRSHGRTWWTRLPWGWGLSEMGPQENRSNPLELELNNPSIEPICKKYARLRYQLMPYTYTLAREAHDTGMPLMRAMWLHYPDDDKARGLGNQFLWGRDLLIAPVFTKAATTRDVYLPAGKWYDFWTNEVVTGKQNVTRQVDLATMPIYVRSGAIIPVDPIRQYTSQLVDQLTTIRIYPGADGEFTLYDDDGISLEYLEGSGNWIRFTWNDANRKLIIEPASPGGIQHKPVHRSFRVEIVTSDRTENVTYEEERIEVILN